MEHRQSREEIMDFLERTGCVTTEEMPVDEYYNRFAKNLTKERFDAVVKNGGLGDIDSNHLLFNSQNGAIGSFEVSFHSEKAAKLAVEVAASLEEGISIGHDKEENKYVFCSNNDWGGNEEEFILKVNEISDAIDSKLINSFKEELLKENKDLRTKLGIAHAFADSKYQNRSSAPQEYDELVKENKELVSELEKMNTLSVEARFENVAETEEELDSQLSLSPQR